MSSERNVRSASSHHTLEIPILGRTMARFTKRSFGEVIRRRRRQLNLTQEEVARRIKTSVPYIAHLEVGKRHPSERVVIKLADALGLDRVELFFLANPGAEAIVSQPPVAEGTSAWERFSSVVTPTSARFTRSPTKSSQ